MTIDINETIAYKAELSTSMPQTELYALMPSVSEHAYLRMLRMCIASRVAISPVRRTLRNVVMAKFASIVPVSALEYKEFDGFHILVSNASPVPGYGFLISKFPS